MRFETLSVQMDGDLSSLRGEEWLDRLRAAKSSAPLLKTYGPRSPTPTYRIELEGYGPAWLKEYRLSRVKQCLSFFRESRAQQVWRVSQQLLASGCEIARPLLLVEVRRFGVLRESYVATKWLEGRVPLTDYLRSGKGSTEEQREAVILEAIRTAAGIHRHGVIHGDLKWSNFLLPRDLQGGVFLVDLDAARFSTSARRRGKDLARFAISALTEGMPVEIMDAIFEEYCEALQPAEAGRIQRAYENYVRKKLPGFFQ